MPEEPAHAEIPRLEQRYARRPDSLVFARLADAYRKAGDLDRALDVVEEGLARHPDYLSARVVRARVLDDLGEAERAARAFESVLDVDPLNLVALRALTEMAERREDEEAARRWGQRLAEADPLDPDTRAWLERLEGTESEEEAVSSDHEASRADPGREDPEHDGDTAAPAEDPERDGDAAVPAEDPEHDGDAAAPAEDPEPDDGTPVTATMAELYMTQGLYEEALRIYRRLLERRPGDPVLAQKAESARILSGRPRRTPPADPGHDAAPPSGPAPEAPPSGPAPEAPAEDAAVRDAGGTGDAADVRPAVVEAEGASPRAGPAAEPGGDGGDTIRRWLRDLLDGSAEDFLPARPRPNAFDAWLDRSRAG